MQYVIGIMFLLSLVALYLSGWFFFEAMKHGAQASHDRKLDEEAMIEAHSTYQKTLVTLEVHRQKQLENLKGNTEGLWYN